MSKVSKFVNKPSVFFKDAIENKKRFFSDSLNVFQRMVGLSEKDKSQGGKKKSAYALAESKYTQFYLDTTIFNDEIVYESFHGRGMSGNPYAIFKYLISHPEYQGLKHTWVINDKSSIPAKYNNKNIKFVRVHTDEYLEVLSRCKYLVNNTTFPTYFQRKPEQVYVNTWHGIPFKTLGKDMSGEKGQHKNIQRNFLQTSHLVMPNEYTTKKIMESHDINDIYQGSIIEAGYPRIDLTLTTDVELLKKELNIPSDKKIVLFAPTWRGNVGSVNNQVENLIDDIAAMTSDLSDDYIFYFRGHALVKRFLENKKLPCKVVPDHIDSNEFLAITDVLISDYSSIVFDFLPLKRNLIIYCHDYEAYKFDRGTYFDIDELPGIKCLTIDQVKNAIKNSLSLENEPAFYEWIEKYCPFEDGSSTERVVKEIFNNTEDDQFQVNGKKNILFYCGGFQNNGITSSAINLINEIDYDRYNVVVVDSGDQNKLRSLNLGRITDKAKIVFRCGAMNVTAPDVGNIKKFYAGHHSSPKLQKSIRAIFKREYRRLFGDIEFDVVIDFSGYVKFWTVMFCFATNARKVVYQHNDMIAESNKKINGVYKHKQNLKTIFYFYRFYDRVISVSEKTMELNKKGLYKNIGYNVDNLSYVTNCINPDDIFSKSKVFENYVIDGFRYFVEKADVTDSKVLNIKAIPFPKKGNVNFITIGRMSPEKRHDKLLHAFKVVSEKHANAYLYVVGSGVLENEVINLARKLNISDKVIFTGQSSNPYALLKKCDCFVLSSDHEGQPMVLLEALTLDKPIIATNITGSASVLGNDYGNLVENTIDGLVIGMNEFVDKGCKSNNFNYNAYIQESMKLFYQEACNEKF